MGDKDRFRSDRRGFVQGALATSAILTVGGARALAQPRGKMTVGFGAVDLHCLTPFVAKSGKFFEEAGLDVTLIDTQTGPRSRQVLAAGQVLVALSAAMDAPALTIAGRRSRIIFGIDRKMDWANIVVRKEDVDSGRIRSLRDLSGKTIASTQPKSASEAVFRYLLGQVGVEDAKIRAVGNNTTCLAMLKSKQVDATFAAPLHLDQITQADGWAAAVFSTGDEKTWNDVVGGEAPGLAYYALESALQDRPDDLRAFVTAMVKAQDFILKKDVETVEEMVFEDYFAAFNRVAFRRALGFMKQSIFSSTNIIEADAYDRMLTVMRVGELQTADELANPDVAYNRGTSFDFVKKARGLG
ncbi:NitT/TauT family transport system substrate-binding protein [Bradyrhizobium sp. AZCC 2289]